MNSAWDIFGQAEKPNLILCNPNKDELYSLGSAHNISLKWKFNALSELTFQFPQRTTESTVNEAYDFLQAKRIILIENFGYFLITKVEEDLMGRANVKTVTANSLEAELIFKKVTAFSGTFQFYNPISPANTLLGVMVALLPNWSISYVDGALLPLYRTFDISDKTIYDFLMNDVATAYQCVFVFDSFNRTISAYSIASATVQTDIFLSFNNLLQSGKLQELTDELVTALHVYGSGSLDIHYVNPLGATTLYNFDYYKNTNWMSQGLINAINLWEDRIAANQAVFANILTELSTAYLDLLTLQGQLNDLTAQLKALQAVKKVRIQQGLPHKDINAQIKDIKNQITGKQAEIDSKNLNISNLNYNMAQITSLLSFANNFTEAQLLELNPFIIENTYQNTNFLITDAMNPAEIQAESQNLYDQATKVLEKVSAPRYEVSFDTANFLFLQNFKPFIDQVQLGCIVTVDAGSNGDEGTMFQLVLLEIDIQLDDPTKFQLTLSNRVRLDKEGFIYSDLFNQAISAGTSVSFKSPDWSNWTDEHKDDVTGFIEGALNAAKNNIVSSDNQEITIDENGLIGKEYDPTTQSYDGDQVWLMNNMLAFTRDSWDSASLAIGRINVDGVSTFGLVADVLIGRILAGNQLKIENKNNTFMVDGTGATLINATLSVIGNGGKNRIFLDPITGFKMQSLVNNQFVDKFYVDNSGNVTFAGILSGASGSFTGAITALSGSLGGWTIDSTGIYDAYGNYIRSNGQIRLGQLTINGGIATFSGTIQATSISGQLLGYQIANGAIGNNHISSLSADKITAGTITGITINGSTITWPGASLYGGAYWGAANIDATTYLSIRAGNGGIARLSVDGRSTGGKVTMAAGDYYFLDYPGASTLWVPTYIKTADGSDALNQYIEVATPGGGSVGLVFTSGLLTAVY